MWLFGQQKQNSVITFTKVMTCFTVCACFFSLSVQICDKKTQVLVWKLITYFFCCFFAGMYSVNLTVQFSFYIFPIAITSAYTVDPTGSSQVLHRLQSCTHEFWVSCGARTANPIVWIKICPFMGPFFVFHYFYNSFNFKTYFEYLNFQIGLR